MTSDAAHCPLKSGSINDLFLLEETTNGQSNGKMVFQVVSMKSCENKKNDAKKSYLVNLRDYEHSFNGFLFPNEKTEELKVEDFIEIISVSPKNIKAKKVFIVKDFVILNQYKGIDYKLPQPIPFNETMVKKKEETHSDAVSTSTSRNYTPLKLLTTFSREFVICVRVTSKTTIKSFSNSSNQNGKLFSFTIMDAEGTEMQVTCFNKVADKFYDSIEKNNVYEIKGGYVKINEKKYSNIKSDYKLVLDERAIVTQVEDTGEIMHEKKNFTLISDIPNQPLYTVVDICGKVLEVSEKILKKTKNGEQDLKKIIIGDKSGFKIELALWRANADIEVKEGEIVYCKHVKIGEFNGRNLSSTDSTSIEVGSYEEEVQEFKQFLSTFNGEFSVLETALSDNGTKVGMDMATSMYIGDLLNKDTELEGKTILLKGVVTQLNHNEKNFYIGCANEKCKKKLTKKDDGTYICNNCNVEYENPAYYYSMSLKVKDCTREHWVDLFGKLAEKIMKIPAEEYKDIINERDYMKLKEISEGIEFKTFLIWAKLKTSSYSGNIKRRLYASKIQVADKNYYIGIKKKVKDALKNLSNS